METAVGILMLILGAIVLFAGLIIYTSFTWGFVLFKFWYWFLLPVFTTVPEISFWQALGLMFIINLFNRKSPTVGIKDEYLKDNKKTVWALVILMPWITLGVGYCIKLFIN